LVEISANRMALNREQIHNNPVYNRQNWIESISSIRKPINTDERLLLQRETGA